MVEVSEATPSGSLWVAETQSYAPRIQAFGTSAEGALLALVKGWGKASQETISGDPEMIAERRLEISLRRCREGQGYVIGLDDNHADRTFCTADELPLVVPVKTDNLKAALHKHYGAIQEVVAAGHTRHNFRSPDWVGVRVAPILGLSSEVRADRKKVVLFLRKMEKLGFLNRVEIPDSNSISRPHYAVGKKLVDESDLE
jgi:hypothetical protein